MTKEHSGPDRRAEEEGLKISGRLVRGRYLNWMKSGFIDGRIANTIEMQCK